MANNYIEDFFISIGFDTKKVKKEASEIDKVLDNLVKKKRNAVSEEVKLKRKLYRLNKSSEADNFKSFLKNETSKEKAIKATEIARRKQALAGLTAKGEGKITAKTSMFTPVKATKTSNELKSAEAIEAIKDKAQKKRYIKRKKHRAALAKSRKKEEATSLSNAQKALKQRLRDFKAHKASLVPEGRVRAQGTVTRFRESRTFSGLGKAKTAGLVDTNFNAMLDKAAMDGNIREVNRLKRSLLGATQALNKQQRATKKLSTVQKGLTDSTRNMIRSYASVYAAFQGTVAIKRVGQDFESLRASMLVVSSSEDDAAKKMIFVREQAYLLGVDLQTAAKAYLALSASSSEALGEEGVKGLFTSVMGISRAFGMSVDDTKGTFKAFTQMLSKGNVQAEELRGQLGERLFGAFNLASKAMGKTTQEMNKALEQGQVTAKDLLPKLIPLMNELANKNGALAKQLQTAQTAQNRFNIVAQEGADTIWKGGMADGMKDLFNTLSELLKDSTPQLKKLGKGFELVFKGLARVLEIVTPILKVVIDYFEWIFGAIMLRKLFMFAGGLNLVSKGFTGAALAAKGFGVSVASSMAVALAPLTAVIAAFTMLDELVASYSDTKVSLKEAAQGYQIINGRKVGVEKRDGQYFSTGDLGAVDYRSATMQRGGSLASQIRGTNFNKSTVTNTSSTVKMEISIKDIPDRKVADHITTEIEKSFSQILSGGLVPQTR